MEHLFMQVFERRDRVSAQYQEQVDSYSQTLAAKLLAAGHKPPEWLLPSAALNQELNGKPIFLTGRNITTPAVNRSVFLPPAVPSTLPRNSEVPYGCAYPDTNPTALGTNIAYSDTNPTSLGTNRHEEEHQDQTSLNQDNSESCTADKMFSRIQHSRSRQKHIEDRLHGKDKAAKCGSRDSMHDGKHRSDTGTLAPNRASAPPSSSIPCDDATNIAETTSSGPGQDRDFCAIQGRSIDHGVQLDGFPSHTQSKIICSNSDIGASNNSSVRDSLSVALPDLSKASIADSACNRIPETHMLVEPKKLQFDGIESVCMNPASEQTDQQQESGVRSDHLDLAGIFPSTGDPSSASSQGPSMGRLSLDHVRLGHLNPDGAPVERHHKYDVEFNQPDLTGMHSPKKKPSLTCPAEAPDSIGEPLLHKEMEHFPENNFSERACPRVSRPLEVDTSNSDDSKFSQRPCSVFNPLLGTDTLQAVEDTEKLQASNSHVSPPCCGPLHLPTQLADSRFGTHASSGTSPNSLVGEDGHLSNLPKNDRSSRYSQGRSALSLELLPPQICISNDVCQSSLSCRTQSSDKHSNGCTAVDNFESAGKELSQEPYLSVRSSLEFNGSNPDVETPFGHPPLDMENEMLKANPVHDLVNCYSGKLGDALISKACGVSADNLKNESVVLKIMPNNSSQRTREIDGTEMNSVVSSENYNESLEQGKEQVTLHAEDDVQINADSCRAENIEKRKSVCTSEPREKSNKHQEDRGSAQMISGADVVQINRDISSKRKRIECKDTVLTSSYGPKPLSPNQQDVTGTHVVTAEKFSGKSQASGRYFLRSSSLRSDGDVQINGGTSSKRKQIKCQDTVLTSSYGRKPSSPNQQDVTGTHVVTAENFSGKSQPSGRYFLRSSSLRSGADVQINGGTSSKRKQIKCQDTVLTSSYGWKPLSPNQQDVTGTHVVTAENFSRKSQPSGRYLRSSGSGEFMSLKSETKNDATNCKMSVAIDVQQNENSYHKLRNRSCLSEIALCNSSSAKALSPHLGCGISSEIAVEEMDLQNYQAQLQNVFDVEKTSALPSNSNIALDSIELCTQEENPYLQGEDLCISDSSVEHQHMSLQMDQILSKSVIINPENYSSTDSTNMFPSYAFDQHSKQVSAPIALVHGKLSYGSSIEVDRKFRSEDLTGRLLSDATIPRQKDDESVDCNDIMPQFESFDFSVPFDSPITEERKFETLHDSRFSTFSSDVSKKYTMNTLSSMCQLLATMSGKAANCSFDDEKQHNESIDGRITDIFGSSGLGRNGSFFTSDVVAPCSSNVSDKQKSSENPLTPAVEKYSLGMLSGKNGSVSEHMGSIPELSCFRIDEDSDIAEENEYQDILPGVVGGQRQSGIKVLDDITGMCQNTGDSASSSIGIMDTSHTDQVNHHPELRTDCDNKEAKQNCVSLVKKGRKMPHSLNNRLSKAEARRTSEANTGKRSKPSNIVANVASFIPLVKPKVQPCVKKDVRVKALEAAEAAKRIEEKIRNEREMRKAARKVEREKLKQERELKQKQEEEQKKKRDVDVATRKRQRDEEERREKERKRKCVEEARKQQKQPMDRRHANSEKYAHPKAADNKELQRNLAEAVTGQVKPDEVTSLGDKATKSNSEKVAIADERPTVFGSQSQENIPTSLEESYMMTPYKDSDDEDEDFDLQEESRQRRKLIPSWARGENLEIILLSNYTMDHRRIFERKCSSNLSEICPVHIPQRGFR